MNATVRLPAVAGQFYPGIPDELRADIQRYAVPARQKLRALGAIVPHAGYMYSGHVAGAVYGALELPRRFIILCPNHTGRGEPLAIMSQGAWRTPLGDAEIDAELAAALKKALPLIAEDTAAHRSEHALEVQLPFLQALVPDFRFVPITVGVGVFEVLSALGAAIARAISETGVRAMILASSDMNHYESDEITRVKDRRAIEDVLRLDPKALYDTVRKHNISMCGYGPTVSMLTAARRLGARSAELIKYATSGDVSGERDRVVGYAGVAVT